MSQSLYPQNNDLGTLKTSYENNPAHARNLLGFIILSVLAGVTVLVMGYMQNEPRDQLPMMGGGLLLLALAVKLYFDYRGRLKVSAAVYEDGFVFTDRRGRHTCRWDDVTEVYETVTYHDRQMRHPRGWRYAVYRSGGEPIKLDKALLHVQELGLAVQKEVEKRLLPQALEIYKTGKTVMFGPQIGLNQQGIVAEQKLLPWEQVANVYFKGLGAVQINQKDQRGAWKMIPRPKIANLPILEAMIRQTMQANLLAAPPVKQQSAPSPFPPGSIGDLSIRLNYDVRELLLAGYTEHEIHGVLQGEYTLEELLQRKPHDKKMNR